MGRGTGMLYPILTAESHKPLGVIHKMNIRRLWTVERRKTNLPRDLRTQGLTWWLFPWFDFFFLIFASYPRPATEETSNPETPTGTDQNSYLISGRPEEHKKAGLPWARRRPSSLTTLNWGIGLFWPSGWTETWAFLGSQTCLLSDRSLHHQLCRVSSLLAVDLGTSQPP